MNSGTGAWLIRVSHLLFRSFCDVNGVKSANINGAAVMQEQFHTRSDNCRQFQSAFGKILPGGTVQMQCDLSHTKHSQEEGFGVN